jgi:hypothetical protein
MPRGSKPVEGEVRDATVCVRFTGKTAKAMDARRGSLSRSDYVRAAVNEKNAREK